MAAVLTGTLGFLCFFAYDINSVTGNYKILRGAFMTGCILNIAAVILMVMQNGGISMAVPVRTGLFLLFGILSFVLLVYTLFFALPFEATYVEESRKRRCCQKGVYALCRHPGVLWYIALYTAIAGALWSFPSLLCCVVLSVWNVLYIVLQDRIIFPRTFSDYAEYQKSTPFLIPNRCSAARCIADLSERSRNS